MKKTSAIASFMGILCLMAFSVDAKINPIVNFWTKDVKKACDTLKESKEKNSKKSFDLDEFSDEIDSDGDDIMDKHEILLGLDPYDSHTDGTYDRNRIFDQEYKLRTLDKENGDTCYTICLSAKASGYFESGVEVRKSALTDHYMDDRRGRAVDFYKCGEPIRDESVFSGIVNKCAIVDIYDISYDESFELKMLTVGFQLDESMGDPENYEIFRAAHIFKSDDDGESAEPVLMPVITSYKDNQLYMTDTYISDEGNKATYALVDRTKLNEFYEYANPGYSVEYAQFAEIVPDKFFNDFAFRFKNEEAFEKYSDEEDDDGDGLSSRAEIYLGTDPNNAETNGTPDNEIKYVSVLDTSRFADDVNVSNGGYGLYIETTSSVDINSIMTVSKSRYEDVFMDDNVGRRMTVYHVSDPEDKYDFMYRGKVNPCCFVGDIFEINVSDIDKVEKIRVAFELPEDISEDEMQYYRVATSTSAEQGVYLVPNVTTQYIGNKAYFTYNRDIKAAVLIDMRKLEEFAAEHNGMTIEEESDISWYFGEVNQNGFVCELYDEI